MDAFPPKAVVFDLDGVLLDSFAANIAYYSYIASQMGLPPLSEHDQMVVHCETHQQALLHLAGPERLEQALAFSREYYARQLQKELKLFDGVREVLDHLRNKTPLAVGTNRSYSAEETLRELGLCQYFALVLTATQAPRPKPEKEFMDCLLGQLGFKPSQVVYVGDSLVDEQLCRNAGVRLVAFKNRDLQAWAHADDFYAIPPLLGLE